MTDIKLSKASGVLDIVISKGALQLVDQEDGLAQRVFLKMSFFQNDWFLDLLFGIPYWGRVFARGTNETDMYGIFTTGILSIPGITQIESLNISTDRENRELNLTADIIGSTGSSVPLSVNIGI